MALHLPWPNFCWICSRDMKSCIRPFRISFSVDSKTDLMSSSAWEPEPSHARARCSIDCVSHLFHSSWSRSSHTSVAGDTLSALYTPDAGIDPHGRAPRTASITKDGSESKASATHAQAAQCRPPPGSAVTCRGLHSSLSLLESGSRDLKVRFKTAMRRARMRAASGPHATSLSTAAFRDGAALAPVRTASAGWLTQAASLRCSRTS